MSDLAADQARMLPLGRRLVGRYLMFALGSVFVCLSLAIALSMRGNFADHAGFVAAAAVGSLAAGAGMLRRMLFVHDAIEQQLRQLSRDAPSATAALKPLPASDATALGWNIVLAQLRDQRCASALEARLSDVSGSVDGRRWNQVFHALQDGIAVCDREGAILMVNNAFRALLGLPPGIEAAGRSVAELLDAAGVSATERLQPTRHTTAPFTAELRKGADVVDGVWRVSRLPLVGDAIEAGASAWTIRDVTQYRIAEEMRNQFVYTASHELRAPLANIKAYAETLANSADIDLDRQKSFYNIIMSEATRLSRFIDQLLDVSQMEAGAAAVHRTEIDLERLLHDAVENMRPNAEQKHLTFEQQLPAKLPKLRLDKDKFTAALVNLLSNAVKYTPDGGTVRLSVEYDETRIDFHVEDTGIGIPAAELPHLCKKFFRSADPRVRKITGSGLGLAFAQEVARRQGGQILVKSEIDKGSRFTLTLPLND